MTSMDTSTHDYTTGIPRHHHSLYLEDGNFVMQVENAIFKVHRSVLAKYFNVMRDMLNVPQESGNTEATDEKPLVLTGDSVSSWELLLGTQYDSPSFLDPAVLSRERVLAILPVAHKYCMEAVESAILKQLKGASTTSENVDLVVAAQIVGSDALYQQGVKALIGNSLKPDLTQAKRIGIGAHYAVMSATLNDVRAALNKALAQSDTSKSDNRLCRHAGCSYRNQTWKCRNCGNLKG